MVEFLNSFLEYDAASRVSFSGFCLTMLITLAGTLLIGLAYCFTHRQYPKTRGFSSVIVIVPVAVAVVLMLIGRNVSTALSVGGLFFLIRFRSLQLAIYDLSFLMVAICGGVICGCGYVAYGFVFSLIAAVLLVLLHIFKWGQHHSELMLLKIWVPETLNFQSVFEPVLQKYTDSFFLLMTRTSDFGSLYEVQYLIHPKTDLDQKKMIDEIRVRNGNMNVVLLVTPSLLVKERDQML